MNVANLELCKELYELSGWGEEVTEFQWYKNEELGGGFVIVHNTEAPFYNSDTYYPAYDLGYLLRKLPNYIPTYGDDGDDYLFSLKPNFEGNEWEVAYWGLQKSLHWQQADTPEDAACKLAIELWKQGVIK